MAQIILAESAAPSTPSSGNVALYAKTDGALYYKDDAGTETGIYSVATHAQTITVTMAANAVTIAALNSMPLEFRSATATSGATTTVTTPSSDLVIPDTATLGSTSAVAATYIVIELNDAGTRYFAVSNQAGGLQCDEQNLVSTTAITTGADSSNVWYSTAAHTNCPYRVIGTFTATEVTAGTWATAASAVQSSFGNALTAMSSIGYGQTWQDVTGSRSAGTTYYNTTGKPILWALSCNSAAGGTMVVNGVSVLIISTISGQIGGSGCVIVPASASYSIAGASIAKWVELR